MYFFDSNILIEFLRGRLPYALELLKNTDSRLVGIPDIVMAELYVGAFKSSNPERNIHAINQLTCNFETIPFDSRCTTIYAKIRVKLESAGKKIGPNDLIIAATALAHDAILVTNNVDEFKRIPGLRIQSLSEVELS